METTVATDGTYISAPLYKMDSKGKIRVWQVEVVGDSYRTRAGIKGGKEVVSGWTKCTPKSQDTAEAQARFEAQAEVQHKLDREYYDNLADAESGVPKMFKPMLAKEYGKEFAKSEAALESGRCLIQPKLDGIRCLVRVLNGEVVALSRQNRRIYSVPHIIEALRPFFDEHPLTVLDGELYNHDLREDFQAITSIVRREKLDAVDLAKSADLIQYHIYDAYAEGNTCLERISHVLEFMDRGVSTSLRDTEPDEPGHPIQFVNTAHLMDKYSADPKHELIVSNGYEGSMIRLPGPYENKRSSLLLKRKDFHSEEFPIVRIEEGNGNWAGYAKRVILSKDGVEFGSGIRGSQPQMKELLANADKYVGGEATCRFFGLTDDGIPRFPVVIDLHPSGRKD